MERFQEVTSQLERALDEISLDEFDISEEVKEQVKRAVLAVFSLDGCLLINIIYRLS